MALVYRLSAQGLAVFVGIELGTLSNELKLCVIYQPGVRRPNFSMQVTIILDLERMNPTLQALGA